MHRGVEEEEVKGERYKEGRRRREFRWKREGKEKEKAGVGKVWYTAGITATPRTGKNNRPRNVRKLIESASMTTAGREKGLR